MQYLTDDNLVGPDRDYYPSDVLLRDHSHQVQQISHSAWYGALSKGECISNTDTSRTKQV